MKQRDIDLVGILYSQGVPLKFVNSDHNKIAEFHNLACAGDLKLIAVTETWLTTEVQDYEVCPEGVNIHRRDRPPPKRGGGIMLAEHSELPSCRRLDLEPRDVEILVCEVSSPPGPTAAVIVCYRPPDSDKHLFVDSLKSVLNSVINHDLIIVLGDFNFPGISWDDNESYSPSTPEATFYDLVHDHFLQQMNHFPSTSHGNILDLILTNRPDWCDSVDTWEGGFPSDHTPLTFKLAFNGNSKEECARTVLNYRKANMTQLRHDLDSLSLTTTIESAPDVNSAWVSWLVQVEQAVKNNVPLIRLKSTNSPPWFDSECIDLSKKKDTAYRKACKKKTNISLWEKYKSLRNSLKSLLNLKHNQFICNLPSLMNENVKRFWGFVHRTGKSRNLPHRVVFDTKESSSPEGKASLFNEYFCSIFSSNVNSSVHDIPSIEPFHSPLQNVMFTTDRVESILKSLDPSKAVGPDGLSPRILRDCADILAPSLTALFQRSMREGRIPKQWQEANVVPVHKKGSREDVRNYRPISLLCVVSKVMERCIYNHLYNNLKDVLSNSQHGFLPGRSTTSQLLDITAT